MNQEDIQLIDLKDAVLNAFRPIEHLFRIMIRTATLLDRDIRQSVQISGKIRARKRPGRK